MWNRVWGFVGALCLAAGLAGESRAGVIIEILQSGSDVLMRSNGGNLNVSGLNFVKEQNNGGGIVPWGVVAGGGDSALFKGDFTSFDFVTSGTPFFAANLHILGPVGFFSSQDPGEDQVIVPKGSINSAWISTVPMVMSVFSNNTVSGLLLIPGSYTAAWGSGPNQDSITVNVIGPAAVPEPGTAAIGLILGGAAMFRRFRKRRA
jgi:hypothetical protein